jgi:hypothetical protein
MRLPEVTFPVHVVGMELNLYRFPYDPVHPSLFLGQNAGVLQLYPLAQVDSVFRQRRLLGMVQCITSYLITWAFYVWALFVAYKH